MNQPLKINLLLFYSFIFGGVLFFLFSLKSFSQNLIPNGDFESFFDCPDNGGQIYLLPYWNNPTWQASTSPDFFNFCGTLGYNLPNTIFDSINAYSGDGCTGIITYHPAEPREYIQVELTEILQAGKKYCVQFFVALADSAQYGAHNIGAYFSNSLIDTNTFYNLPYAAQISNPSTNPLTTKGVWTKIYGEFIATGGEKYMTIGNFNNNAGTNEVFLGGASWANVAFYFLDSVSVIMCDSSVGIAEPNDKLPLIIYPNPANDKIMIDISSSVKITDIEFYSSLGTRVKTIKNFHSGEIDISELPSGSYFVRVISFNQSYVQKLIIQN